MVCILLPAHCSHHEGHIEGWTDVIEMDLPEVHNLIETKGPVNHFNNVLFIEKEGFTEILKDAEIPERYSMALMSTKGIPVDAACDLIRAFVNKGVRVFVLHDFDLDGFKILRTLRIGTRLSSGSDVIDIGLRMADIEGLPSEPVLYKQTVDPSYYLRHDCGATEEEAAFLVNEHTYGAFKGNRVEINAMMSEELITWLEKKFEEHGVKKLIPDEEVVKAAYQRAVFLQRIQERIEELTWELENEEIELPPKLYAKVTKAMENGGTQSWDEVVWELAEKFLNEEKDTEE